jgi:hypothetical protein
VFATLKDKEVGNSTGNLFCSKEETAAKAEVNDKTPNVTRESPTTTTTTQKTTPSLLTATKT